MASMSQEVVRRNVVLICILEYFFVLFNSIEEQIKFIVFCCITIRIFTCIHTRHQYMYLKYRLYIAGQSGSLLNEFPDCPGRSSLGQEIRLTRKSLAPFALHLKGKLFKTRLF